jgi:hypothetical protein
MKHCYEELGSQATLLMCDKLNDAVVEISWCLTQYRHTTVHEIKLAHVCQPFSKRSSFTTSRGPHLLLPLNKGEKQILVRIFITIACLNSPYKNLQDYLVVENRISQPSKLCKKMVGQN